MSTVVSQPTSPWTMDLSQAETSVQWIYLYLLKGTWMAGETLRRVGGVAAMRRLSDMRGPKWGPLRIEARLCGPIRGMYEYRLDIGSITPHIHQKILNGKPDRVPRDPNQAQRVRVVRMVREAPSEILDHLESLLAVSLGWAKSR